MKGMALGFVLNDLPPAVNRYPRRFWISGWPWECIEHLEKLFDYVPKQATARGDIILFKPPKTREGVGHLAIMDDPGTQTFKHVWMTPRKNGRGLHVNRLVERYWDNLYFASMRFKRMDELRERVTDVAMEHRG